MNKLAIFGLCIIVLLVSSGASYRFYLSQYEEECYEYRTYETEWCSGYWDERGCNCGYVMWMGKDDCLFTVEETNYSDCRKYHLVRGVKSE